VSAPEPLAQDPERRELEQLFVELCAIESPSRSERACADRVAAELRALGLEVEEDDAGARTGSDSGNLLARIHPSGNGDAPWLMLCAHLDTVPLAAPVEPVLVDGFYENANAGILGADNKAAVAVLLSLARRLRRRGSPIGVELLFTVCEEVSLAGAQAFDASRLRSVFGYAFDHASPIGGVIVSSPTHYRFEATFRGSAAHAGIRPELGRSAILAAARAIAAMPLGRIDARTTANVGTIHGGSAINVVPDTCTVTGEVRSLDAAAAESLVAQIVDRIHEAANRPDCDVDVDLVTERTFTGYELAPSTPGVAVAEAALRACGHEPELIRSGGGADVNALIAQGFPAVNLANATERNHEPGERVSAQALHETFDLALALVAQTARLPAAEPL
jgi:tripeptide aminopeptidase